VLFLDVALEGLILFLKGLPGYFTNIAFVLLIVRPGILLLSQTAEGVQHQTANYAAEHYLKEDEVDHIVTESY